MATPTIEAVDFFYLAMPEIRAIGDGSQDMLLVRVRAGGHTGWGECEASPLASIAGLVAPMSHSACQPVLASVLGQPLRDVADISRISQLVKANSLDLLQADHTLSGIEIAMWDLLGRRLAAPVYELLGAGRALPKRAYASALFGDTPEETYAKALSVAGQGFRAAKFGWGAFGRGTVEDDAAHIHAARDGLGPDRSLLVDAGTVFGEDIDAAALRLPALADARVGWLEEPFVSGAFGAYRQLAAMTPGVPLAAGEGAHDPHQAIHQVDHAGIGYVQVDTGRIGGIGPAARVAAYAAERGVQFVNHTFTSHLALSASLQPFAGVRDASLCEYPVEASALAMALTADHLLPDANGEIVVPAAPGLGVSVQPDAVRQYLVDAEIRVAGRTLYQTPEL
ncbi:enolase C-terminal domain-like protein [Actinopolymorpha sp. B17G11]|uniref:mandelate racemase/muconate lactonizing enzyme family protein n=1 Tax=Actinopolymorpha sp. B17G11 TaxID=3160861 RepID=UPI0032E3D5F4